MNFSIQENRHRRKCKDIINFSLDFQNLFSVLKRCGSARAKSEPQSASNLERSLEGLYKYT